MDPLSPPTPSELIEAPSSPVHAVTRRGARFAEPSAEAVQPSIDPAPRTASSQSLSSPARQTFRSDEPAIGSRRAASSQAPDPSSSVGRRGLAQEEAVRPARSSRGYDPDDNPYMPPRTSPGRLLDESPAEDTPAWSPAENTQTWSPAADEPQAWTHSHEETQSWTPAEDTQAWAPTENTQTWAPTENTQTWAPTENTQTWAPTENTQTWSPAADEPQAWTHSHEETQSWTPAEDTQAWAPTENTQTWAPTENTQTWAPTENTQTWAPTENTQTWSPAADEPQAWTHSHEETQSWAPAEDTQTWAPTENTQTWAPTEDTQAWTPSLEDTQAWSPADLVEPAPSSSPALDDTQAWSPQAQPTWSPVPAPAPQTRASVTPTVWSPTTAQADEPAEHHRPPAQQVRHRPLTETTDFAVQTLNLTKTYGTGAASVVALDKVNVGFEPGSFTAIMGPSGSGKSTLMHCLAGLDSATSGHIFLGDAQLDVLNDDRLTRLRRDRIGFIFQSFNLLPTLTAKQNILLPLELAGKKPDKELFAQLVDSLGLGKRLGHRPSELSGGQQQRVAVARALITRPEVVFADEPTGALDRRMGRALLRYLRSCVDETGQTIIMVTHDAQAAAFADRALILVDGQVVDDIESPTAQELNLALDSLDE